MSNYPEVLKKAFPASSEMRSNESSNASILIDALGKDLENITTESIRKAEIHYSEGSWLNASGEVYVYTKESSDSLSLDGYKKSSTFENFFTDLSEFVFYSLDKTNSFEEITIQSKLEERKFVQDYLKIDVYELSGINKKRIEDKEEDIVLGIFLRGVDYFNNKVEEFVPIEEEGFYISKTRFLYLEPLEYIKSLNIGGGPAVEAVGAENFVYKISNKYYRDWVTSGEVKTKTFRSKKTSFNIQEAEREAKLEEAYAKYVVEKTESSTKVKCIHRMLGLNRFYKNKKHENILEELEEITYEIELVDNSGDSLSLIDCCYSEKYEKLFGLTTNGSLLAYDISPPSFVIGRHERSREADLKIDVDLRRPHKDETVNLRVFTSSPTFYTDYFVVIKHDRVSNTYSTLIDKAYDENKEYKWAEDSSINYLHGLGNLEENQDSVLITTFEDSVEQGQIDYYVLNIRNKKIFNESIGDLASFGTEPYKNMETLRKASMKSGGSCYRTSILSSKVNPVYEKVLSNEGIEESGRLNIKRLDHSIEISETPDSETVFKEERNYFIQENKKIYFLKENPDVKINNINVNENNVSKILLSTKIDNTGLLYSLSRENNESLDDYWRRIEIAKKLDFKIDIDSLSYSLLYKRQSNAKAEFCILSSDKKIEFLSSGIKIESALEGEVESILYSYKEYKFNKDLLELFDQEGIDYKILKDYNEWTRCKFLSRLSLEKIKINERLEEKRNYLSETAIAGSVYPRVAGITSTNLAEETGASSYSFDNNINVVWLNNEEAVNFNYKYSNLPLVIWSCDSNWFSLEDEDLDYRIKNKDKTLADEKMILTQEGVKVINKVLKHYNYYWGQ